MRLTGYRRPDGRVGVRNRVVVLPVDDLSNRAAALVPGVVALTHPYGRLQFGEDRELTFPALAGHGANPFREEEALGLANALPVGLVAYVFTRDLGRAFRVREALGFGIVGVSDGFPSTPEAPFGG